MIGRLYTWQGAVWLLLVRWAPPSRDDTEWRCNDCGRIRLAHPDRTAVPHVCLAHDEPTTRPMRRVRGPVRNVLLEQVIPMREALRQERRWLRVTVIDDRAWSLTGTRVVRPFRGLRRWRP